MSLTSTSNRVTATGDGVTTLFNYNKQLYDSTHLQVYLDSVLQTTGYTVGGVPGTSTNVTFSAAPASGVQVSMLRVVPLTQLSVYAVGGAFPAATTEKNFDLVVMGLQQFDDTTNRTLRQPVTDTTNIATIPVKASRASMYLAFDVNGDPVATTGTSETPNALLKTGGNLTGGLNEARGSVVQHATTMDLFAITSPGTLDGTGSAVTITDIVDAPQAGPTRRLYPIVGTVITHGATFSVTGNASYTTLAGDCLEFEAVTISTFKVRIIKQDGTAVVGTYTQGAWTPTLVPGTSGAPTYSSQVGLYTKVGRLVTVQWWLTGAKNTCVGTLSLGGLPFSSNSTANMYVGVPIGLWYEVGGSLLIGITGQLLPSATAMPLYTQTAAAAAALGTAWNATDISANFQLSGSFSYMTD